MSEYMDMKLIISVRVPVQTDENGDYLDGEYDRASDQFLDGVCDFVVNTMGGEIQDLELK